MEWKFPCLGKSSTGTVVLFYRKEEGVCLIKGGTCVAVAEYWNEWQMECFTPLPSTESVTLQND